MIVIPIVTQSHTNDALLVVIDALNLERMKAADPAEVTLNGREHYLVNPRVLICYEEITPEFKAIIDTRDLDKIIAHLRRGFTFRPDLGDHDLGPQPLAQQTMEAEIEQPKEG
jgi:hypothetical protein